jgi:hypothetical protein
MATSNKENGYWGVIPVGRSRDFGFCRRGRTRYS